MRALPHLITLLRLLATPVDCLAAGAGGYRAALAMVVLAGVTDWLDGFAARLLKLSGQFGVVFDPLADKVLLVTLFFALGLLGLIPLWMLCLAVGRDLVIVGGAALVRNYRGPRKFRPTLLGKVSTFFQIVLVLLALSFAAYPLRSCLAADHGTGPERAVYGLERHDYVRLGIADGTRTRSGPRGGSYGTKA